MALVHRGLCESRTAAQKAIREGRALLGGRPCPKPSTLVEAGDAVALTGDAPRYVGRGGEKLEGALRDFGIDPTGCTVLDVGASTGGFADCLLQHGASGIIAIDVGHGQLHPRMAADARVISVEGFNARELSAQSLTERMGPLPPIGGCTADVSFISLTHILPGIKSVLMPGGWCCALVKPQFECGPSALDRHGVVRRESDRAVALTRVIDAAEALGFAHMGSAPSRLRGGDGNMENFVFLCNRSS